MKQTAFSTPSSAECCYRLFPNVHPYTPLEKATHNIFTRKSTTLTETITHAPVQLVRACVYNQTAKLTKETVLMQPVHECIIKKQAEKDTDVIQPVKKAS